MERHSLRALLSVALLVVLAWIGIALVGKLHGSGGHEALIVVWAVVVAIVVAIGIWSLVQARRCRLERKPEGSGERR